MAVYPQSITYRDAKGQVATVRLYVSNATAAGALAAGLAISNAIDDITNASNNGARGAYTSSPTGQTYGADAAYPTIEDKLVLTFRTAAGSMHRYQIPAPLTAMFREDDETAKSPDSGGDAQQVFLDTLVNAMVGDACSRDGNLLSAYVGGIRIRRKFKRKFDIFTLNPDLSGPGE